MMIKNRCEMFSEEKMITLLDLFFVTDLPMIDSETGEQIDSNIVLKHPDATVENISCNGNFKILVSYKERE